MPHAPTDPAHTSGKGPSCRTLDGRDLPALVRLLSRAVMNDYILPMAAEWLSSGKIIGGWKEDRLIGVLRVDDLGWEEGWCGGIRVDPEYRKQGIGKELMEYTFSVAKDLGLRTLRLFIEKGNAPSQRLALSVGFREVLTLAHFAGNPRNALPGAKVISDPLASKIDAQELQWTRAFQGFMSPTMPEAFCMVRASQYRLDEERKHGRLFHAGDSIFALAPPHRVTWSGKRLRACVPIHGKIDAILSAAAGLTGYEDSVLDCFLPIDDHLFRSAEESGLTRGALWGFTIHLYECDVR